MKFHTEYLWFNTKKHREYVNITDEVAAAVAKSRITDGMVLISAMHITAGVYVNDAESGIIHDIDEWAETLAPFRSDYRHHMTGETNGDSHLKSLLIGHEVILPVTEGRLDLGPGSRCTTPSLTASAANASSSRSWASNPNSCPRHHLNWGHNTISHIISLAITPQRVLS